MQEKDVKKIIMDICYQDGITRRDILAAYNKSQGKELQEASFNRMVNTNSIKYKNLFDILNAIGYTIEIKKKL